MFINIIKDKLLMLINKFYKHYTLLLQCIVEYKNLKEGIFSAK